MTWHAWLDETRIEPNIYIFAAALISPIDINHVRTQMQELLLAGQKKLHWRDESAPRKAKIAGVIAGCTAVEHLVIVRSGGHSEQQERQRKRCLQHLLFCLDDHGVELAIFESRGAVADSREVNFRNQLDSWVEPAGLNVRITHRRGPADALLWIPDAVAGAYRANRLGTNTYYDMLETRVIIIDAPD